MGFSENLSWPRIRFAGSGTAAPRTTVDGEILTDVLGRGDGGYPVGFVPQLEAVRGVAALLVAAFHAAQAPWVGSPGNQRTLYAAPDLSDPLWGTALHVYRALCNGHGAVNFFFVLSGFVLAASLYRGTRNPGLAACRFFTGRLLRLYPAVFFAVLAFTTIYWISSAFISSVPASYFGFNNVLRKMLLLDTRIDGVMWSLQVELIATPLIFGAVLASWRWGHAAVIPLAAALMILSFSGWWNSAFGFAPSRLGPLYCFPFGMLVGSVGRAAVRHMSGLVACWLFAAALLVFFAARPTLGYSSNWSALTEAWASATLVAIIVYGKAARFVRPLDWAVIRFYGRISYSFYLLHPVSLIVVWNIPDHLARLLNAGVPSVAVALGLAVLSVAAITPVAWLSWRFVELPGMALGRCLSHGRLFAAR